MRYPPLPRWFFLAQAASVAGLHLAQMLPSSDASKATFAVALVAMVLGSKYWLNREGVSWVWVKPTDMVLFMAAILGTFGLSWGILATTGAWWIWIVGAVVAGGIVLATGRRYRQEFGDDA